MKTIIECPRLLAGLVALLGLQAGAGITFQEDFRLYKDYAPGMVRDLGLRCANDAAQQRAELTVSAEKDGDVYAKPIPAPKVAFDVLTRFRLMSPTSSFDVVFLGAKGERTVVNFSTNAVSGAKYPFPEPFLAVKEWQEAVLTIKGTSAEVFVAVNRVFRKVTTVRLAAPAVGVNFGVKAFKPVNFDYFKLRTAEPIEGYPAEKHFANFRSLDKNVANVKRSDGASRMLFSAERLGFRIQIGSNTNAFSSFTLVWSDGGVQKVTMSARPQVWKCQRDLNGGPKKGQDVVLADSLIRLEGFAERGPDRTLDFYVRPYMRTFTPGRRVVDSGVDVIREWDTLPAASKHLLDVDFVKDLAGVTHLYLDGSWMQSLKGVTADAKLVGVIVSPLKGVAFQLKSDRLAGVDTARYLPLDFAANPRAKAFASAKFAEGVKEGLATIGGVPLEVANPLYSADVGICREGAGVWALEVDEYHGRLPQWGFPSAIHYRVPAAPYARAHVLFAFDPDSRKDRILVTRLARYRINGTGDNMLADTTLDFNAGIPDHVREVGKIRRGGQLLSVYFMTVPLNVGRINDLVFNGEYFDFEFAGKSGENLEQIDNSTRPDPNSTSAFNIFAVTLEKAPVTVDVVQEPTAPGNVFTCDEEDRKVTLRIAATRDGAKGKVAWRAIDLDGETVFDDDVRFAFGKAGEAKTVEVELDDAEKPGLYRLPVSVLDADGKPLYTHEARFAILPKAGRAVKPKDSPYSTWWFDAHGSPKAPEIGGPLLKKAGIAKFSANRFKDPALWAKYNVVNDGHVGRFPRNLPTNEVEQAKLAAKFQAEIDSLPFASHIMLWHESAPGCPIPEELLGLPVPKDVGRRGPDAYFAKCVNDAGAFMRKYFPNLKLQIGNTTCSIGASSVPFRGGANPDYYDVIGIETPSQVIPPERLTDCNIQAAVVCEDVASRYARRRVATSGCYEFTYRADRDMGEELQACWYVRDVLVSLAHGFFLISPGIFFDCTGGYYSCFYGGSGLVLRAPTCYPKLSYVAYAALTYAMDGVTEIRQLDTGSTSAYALQGRRADGRYATALWAARGVVDFAVVSPVKGTVVHMYGDESKLGKDGDTVSAGERPAYVVTERPLRSVRVAARHTPRGDGIAARGTSAPVPVVGHGARLEPDPVISSDHHDFLPIMKASDFLLAEVDDPEEGKCLEVKLDLSKNRETPKYVTEFTTVRFDKPLEIAGEPDVLFARVKGDSNWGQIRFEIEDAKGEIFKNVSTGRDWGCDIMDWPGNLALNFDGWGWVWNSFAKTDLMPEQNPGPCLEQWASAGGDKKIQFPIRVRAISVGVNRQKLGLTTFSPSEGVIRLKSVGGAR